MVVPRWGRGTSLITWAPKAAPDVESPTRVNLLGTNNGVARPITEDAGNKIDPWLWRTPEHQGELFLATNVDGAALVLYRDVRGDGGPWQRAATIQLPQGSKPLKSVEPVSGGRGAFGQSWFTAQVGGDDDTDTSIWLLGQALDGRHVVRRLDEGAVAGKPARRLDPESLVGAEELFVYYTLTGEGPTQLRRCRTGSGQPAAVVFAGGSPPRRVGPFPSAPWGGPAVGLDFRRAARAALAAGVR